MHVQAVQWKGYIAESWSADFLFCREKTAIGKWNSIQPDSGWTSATTCSKGCPVLLVKDVTINPPLSYNSATWHIEDPLVNSQMPETNYPIASTTSAPATMLITTHPDRNTEWEPASAPCTLHQRTTLSSTSQRTQMFEVTYSCPSGTNVHGHVNNACRGMQCLSNEQHKCCSCCWSGFHEYITPPCTWNESAFSVTIALFPSHGNTQGALEFMNPWGQSSWCKQEKCCLAVGLIFMKSMPSPLDHCIHWYNMHLPPHLKSELKNKKTSHFLLAEMAPSNTPHSWRTSLCPRKPACAYPVHTCSSALTQSSYCKHRYSQWTVDAFRSIQHQNSACFSGTFKAATCSQSNVDSRCSISSALLLEFPASTLRDPPCSTHLNWQSWFSLGIHILIMVQGQTNLLL